MTHARHSAGHPAPHGGDLADAMALAGDLDGRREDWLDLSTGLNPHAYPLPPLDGDDWERLPSRSELDRLIASAATYYRAPGTTHLVAAPGSQALIQTLPRLMSPTKVAVVAPTYGSHVPAWRGAGHEVREVARLEDADPDETTVLVNPNNPDGRLVDFEALSNTAEWSTAAGGRLIVDEAFGDVMPEASANVLTCDNNVVVLKSFSKFFGLGGVRLGFAIAPAELATQLRDALGCWAVNGPAIAIGAAALADTAWHAEQRDRLSSAAKRLDAVLGQAGFRVVGGTSLYRLVDSERAQALFTHLLSRRIYVRRFTYRAHWLRFGLPGSDSAFARLDAALRAFAE